MEKVYAYSFVLELIRICKEKGMKHVVLSPGSRCAPLVIACNRTEGLATYSISDERSAGFVALGMAIRTGQPVGLVCTSGSALANYYPAVLEAYYQEVPLVILSADRPPEWIGQQDGQTIQQPDIFGKHIKASYNMPVVYADSEDRWFAARVINEGLGLANLGRKGPVHFNFPFREPIYPDVGMDVYDHHTGEYKVLIEAVGKRLLPSDVLIGLQKEVSQYNKVMLIVGQGEWDEETIKIIKNLDIPVVADVISGIPHSDNVIRFQDLFLKQNGAIDKRLCPQLVVVIGKSVLSKNLKLFIRENQIEELWQIQPDGEVADVFQSLTKVLYADVKQVLRTISFKSDEFLGEWRDVNLKTKAVLTVYTNQMSKGDELFDLTAIALVLDRMPVVGSSLHLANSLAVRYANFLGANAERVVANRGVSGIDGSNSTAMGYHILGQTNEATILITGDVAFLYDRNAFWNKYSKKGMKILLLNNAGGGIFNMIPGPASLPEAQSFFYTEQLSGAKDVANEFGFKYLMASTNKEFPDQLEAFYAERQGVILEVITDMQKSTSCFKGLKKAVAKHLMEI